HHGSPSQCAFRHPRSRAAMDHSKAGRRRLLDLQVSLPAHYHPPFDKPPPSDVPGSHKPPPASHRSRAHRIANVPARKFLNWSRVHHSVDTTLFKLVV